MMKRNRVWAGMHMYVGLLVIAASSSVHAAVYRIDSQIDFDFYKGQPFIRGSDPTYSQEEIPDEYDIHKAELPLDSEIKELIVEAFEREREEVEA